MARRIGAAPRHGEVWTYDFRRPDKSRPVLVVSRNEAIRFLHAIMVAPITSTIRGLPSEVVVGIDEGLRADSAVRCDQVQTVEKTRLRRFLGSLRTARMREVCRALAVATGCDPASAP